MSLCNPPGGVRVTVLSNTCILISSLRPTFMESSYWVKPLKSILHTPDHVRMCWLRSMENLDISFCSWMAMRQHGSFWEGAMPCSPLPLRHFKATGRHHTLALTWGTGQRQRGHWGAEMTRSEDGVGGQRCQLNVVMLPQWQYQNIRVGCSSPGVNAY